LCRKASLPILEIFNHEKNHSLVKCGAALKIEKLSQSRRWFCTSGSTYPCGRGDRTAEATLGGALKGFLTSFDIRFASCSMKTAYLNSSCEIVVGGFDVADRIGAAMKSAGN
jgi:hypothetical protein